MITFHAKLNNITAVRLNTLSQDIIEKDTAPGMTLKKFVELLQGWYKNKDKWWRNEKSVMQLLDFEKCDPPENSNSIPYINFMHYWIKLSWNTFTTIRPPPIDNKYNINKIYEVRINNHQEIYVDGGHSPTSAYAGFFHEQKKKRVMKKLKQEDETNNTAEYKALLLALDYLIKNNIQGCAIYSDSQLVVKQTINGWKINKDHLKLLNKEAREKLRDAKGFLIQIPREENIAHVNM